MNKVDMTTKIRTHGNLSGLQEESQQADHTSDDTVEVNAVMAPAQSKIESASAWRQKAGAWHDEHQTRNGQGREERHVHREQPQLQRNHGYVLEFELHREVGEGRVTGLKGVTVNSVEALLQQLSPSSLFQLLSKLAPWY